MTIFNISDAGEFETEALKIFRHQAKNNKTYKQFLDLLKIDPLSIGKVEDIPFIPVDFFKSQKITWAVVKEGNVEDIKRIVKKNSNLFSLKEFDGFGGKYIGVEVRAPNYNGPRC